MIGGGSRLEIYSESTFEPRDPFAHAYFKKGDIRMVNDAANAVGVSRKGFGNYIHEIKSALGMGASPNFTYQELLELAEEFKNMTK